MIVPANFATWLIQQDAVRNSLLKLRNDALARDFKELTLAYGWSIIRINAEMLLHRNQILHRNMQR